MTLMSPIVAQVLLAGFGTMAFFRTSLFTLRITCVHVAGRESDVAIGPAAVVQVIINAADRACDRFRAGPRSSDVVRIIVACRSSVPGLPCRCTVLL
jgi:hypothetical protein